MNADGSNRDTDAVLDCLCFCSVTFCFASTFDVAVDFGLRVDVVLIVDKVDNGVNEDGERGMRGTRQCRDGATMRRCACENDD